VSAVISNRAEAEGLAIAEARGIATRVVYHRGRAAREDFDAALAAEIERFAPRLVALAGFMRVLTPGFVGRYRERLLNIHPSLLPAFPGLHTHERALAAGVKVHGCTVHFVTPELDHGPIVIQAAVRVRAGDDAPGLAARVLPSCPGGAGWRSKPVKRSTTYPKKLALPCSPSVTTSTPAAAVTNLGLGPRSPASSYCGQCTMFGKWASIAAGTAVTIAGAFASTLGGTDPVKLLHVAGTVRLVPFEF